MSIKYLGEDFDIHGGGQDLTFPHHENEIAQSCGATGKGFAKVWLHNGFVNVNKEKMSKSLGNFFTLKDILEKHDPMAVRYFLLSQHYRSPVEYSDESLESAAGAWRRVRTVLDRVRIWMDPVKAEGPNKPTRPLEGFKEGLIKYQPRLYELLANDFDTSNALTVLHDLISYINEPLGKMLLTVKQAEDSERAILDLMEPLGLRYHGKTVADFSNEVHELAEKRKAARKAHNWAESDALRIKLRGLGVTVEDTASGQVLRKLD